MTFERPIDVLLVEPNNTSAEIASTFLQGGGYSLMRGSNAAFAISGAFGVARPSIIVLQCRLGGIGSIEVITQIRRIEKLIEAKPVPILGMNADTTLSTSELYLSAGANKILGIPFDRDSFLAAVHSLIGTPSNQHPLLKFAKDLEAAFIEAEEEEGERANILKH